MIARLLFGLRPRLGYTGRVSFWERVTRQTNVQARLDVLDDLEATVRQHMPGVTDEVIHLVTAISGLLAVVAYADRELTESERQHIEGELRRLHDLSAAGIEAIIALLSERIADLAHMDHQIHTRVIRDLADRNLRWEVLEVLVELAASDDRVSLQETNILRRVASAIGLTQADYNALQAKHKAKLTTLSSKS